MRRAGQILSFLILVISLAAMIFMSGCEKQKPTKTEVKTTEAKTEVNKTIAKRIFDEIWNQGKLDLADEIIATDLIRNDAGNPDANGPVGSEGFKQLVAMYRAAFHGVQFVYDDLIAKGDMTIGRWTATSIHQGEFMGIPATGTAMTVTGISIVRYSNGKMVEEWVNWDSLGMMQQLGAITPGRPGAENYTWGASSEITGDSGDPAANKTMVLDFIEELWNKQNLDVLDETHHPDIAAHTPVELSSPLVGLEINKQTVKLYLTAFPDMHTVNEDVFAEGDKVVVRWRTTGTHLGELAGVPPTGRQVEFTGITIYRMADGKSVENWWAWDAMGLMQQLTASSE